MNIKAWEVYKITKYSFVYSIPCLLPFRTNLNSLRQVHCSAGVSREGLKRTGGHKYILCLETPAEEVFCFSYMWRMKNAWMSCHNFMEYLQRNYGYGLALGNMTMILQRTCCWWPGRNEDYLWGLLLHLVIPLDRGWWVVYIGYIYCEALNVR
jgi:hypothetical protein